LLISAEQAKALLKRGATLLDVRTDLEVKTLGADPRALHIPSAELDKRTPELPDKNKDIVIYCNTGQRARAAAEKLKRFGYSKVHYIAGS
jgi:phage shock protein E